MAKMPLVPVADPPLVEVACGVHFAGFDIDPLMLGWYWRSILERFPKHQLQPALMEPGHFAFSGTGALPIRSWLISYDDVWLLQVQHDRVFLNWRKQGATAYPRFAAVLRRALEEFEAFQAFCKTELHVSLQYEKSELTKVNHLVAGRHWQSRGDLSDVVPLTRGFFALPEMAQGNVLFQLQQESNGSATHVTAAMQRRENGTEFFALELRASGACAGALDAVGGVLAKQNEKIDALFGDLVPQDQRAARFGGNL